MEAESFQKPRDLRAGFILEHAPQGSVSHAADLPFTSRYGGEEIAIILPSTDPHEAVIVAEAVRNAIASLRIPHAGNPEGGSKVTASFGVATALARAGGAIRMPESLVLSADKALYMAKSEGRNCVRKVMMMAAPNKATEA